VARMVSPANLCTFACPPVLHTPTVLHKR
jgi:hypothetical protein